MEYVCVGIDGFSKLSNKLHGDNFAIVVLVCVELALGVWAAQRQARLKLFAKCFTKGGLTCSWEDMKMNLQRLGTNKETVQ